jgi:hypothetical protein
MLVLLAALYWAIILHQRGLRFAPSVRCARIPVVRPCLSPVGRAQHSMCRKGTCVRHIGFSHRVGAFSLFGPGLYNAPYRRKEAWVEENHRRKAKPEPVLGLAGVTTLASVMLFALAIHRVSHSVWSKATIAFLMGVVALITAGRLYAAWLSLRQGSGDRGPDT